MARKYARPAATHYHLLTPRQTHCPHCGSRLWVASHSERTILTLEGLCHFTLVVRWCRQRTCPRYHRPFRPEAEGAIALPKAEIGLDVIALVGRLRFAEQRSIPEIHQLLHQRGLALAQRSVTNLLYRYEELLALSVADHTRLRERLTAQGQVILALDGLQPDVGHEVLWVVRDCISGEILLARSLLSGREADLVTLLQAVADALPYLREAATPIYDADRHAKKELKKQVRGVRPIERALEARDDPEADAMRGYCLAVRSALTDDGQPPLEAAGLRLEERLQAIASSLDRVEREKGGSRVSSPSSSGCSNAG